MLRIGIDAMGGDFAPDAVVLGVIDALPELDNDSQVVLFGDKEKINQILEREGCKSDKIEIVHTSEVITMNDHPVKAFQTKEDSSIRVGFKYLKEGKIDGFASAGSTGAVMVGVSFSTRIIENVIRPVISAAIANDRGGYSLLLDVGLNVDCKPDVLFQYGLMGSVYAKAHLGIENPRVALMNVGSESVKGNLITKAAYEIMEGTKKFNFVGNMEGHDYFTGEIADVIVCDGFLGNILLKTAESLRTIALKRDIKDEFLNNLNYEIMGGTPVLGINDVVMVGHGNSTLFALKNMVLQVEKSVQSGYVEELKKVFSSL